MFSPPERRECYWGGGRSCVQCLSTFKARARSCPLPLPRAVAKYSGRGTLPSAAAPCCSSSKGSGVQETYSSPGSSPRRSSQFPCNSGFADSPLASRLAGRPCALRTDGPNCAERQRNKVPQNSPSLLGEFAICSGPDRGGKGSAQFNKC